AQWHNYCTAGHCITHSNYTLEGQHACGPADVTGTNPTSGLDDATCRRRVKTDPPLPVEI
ncbi:MAG: hypothetical protein ACXVHJ_36620, partial [Solirubrobacteraceae bacterium]